HPAQPDLVGVRVHPGRVHTHLPLQRLVDGPPRREGPRRRPVGLRRLLGVGDLLPAAAAQLYVAAADPLRAARLRPAPRPPAASHAGTPGGPAGTSPAERRRPGTVLT